MAAFKIILLHLVNYKKLIDFIALVLTLCSIDVI